MLHAKRRVAAVGAELALSVATLVGVSPAHAATKNLTVWTDEQRGPVLKALLAGKNPVPGYKIVVKTFSNLDALNAAWNAATAATGPDVIISNAGLAASGAKSGKLLALTLPAATKAQFGAAAFVALGYQGKSYGVPLDVDTTALFWNKKLFGKKAPTTFGAMVNYYKTNKTAKSLTAGLCIKEGAWGAQPVITALGGSAWTYAANGSPVANSTKLNSAAFKANFATYLLGTDGKSNGFLSMDGDGCLADFKAGKVPFLNTGGWNVEGIQNAGVSFGIGSVPGIKAGTYGSPWTGFQAAYVTAYTNNHKVKAGAMSFAVKYLAGAQVQAQLSAAGGRPPANLKAAKIVNDPVVAGIALAGSRGILQLSPMLDADAAGSNWYALIPDAFNKVLVDGDAVGTTMDTLATKVKQNFVAGAAAAGL